MLTMIIFGTNNAKPHDQIPNERYHFHKAHLNRPDHNCVNNKNKENGKVTILITM